MYALTGDSMYKEKAKEVADKLLPAFQTPTGIPKARVDIKTGVSGATNNMKVTKIIKTVKFVFQLKNKRKAWVMVGAVVAAFFPKWGHYIWSSHI